VSDTPSVFLERLEVGSTVTERTLRTISGRSAELPDPDALVHVQFRRFAGCPVCDLHLHDFTRRHAELLNARIRELVVFHSTTQDLLEYESQLPFDVIADPDKRMYREFGVESSFWALFDPRVWLTILWAVLRSLVRIVRRGSPVPPLWPRGGRFGLCADFMINCDGRVVAAKYGAHAGDHWSVDEVLSLAGRARGAPASAVERGNATSAEPQKHTLATPATRLAIGAYAVLALTTLHHVYGAWRYQTPFRLHVVGIAVAVAACILATLRLFLRKRSRPFLIAFAAATLLFPVVGIGIFEGGYNHLAKNVLYLAGTPERALLTLFPPPTYVLPNDVFFELTGVLQVLPAAITAHAFAVLLRHWRSARN
jgi:peroxiredoxin